MSTGSSAPATNVWIVAVFGNHDVESGREEEVQRALAEAGVSILDGDACEVAGIGVAGIKGFDARDTLVTVINTMWGSFWIAIGILYAFTVSTRAFRW